MDEDFHANEWITCWSCGGNGFHESCPEDTCVCLNPPCFTADCDVCDGSGGWMEEGPEE